MSASAHPFAPSPRLLVVMGGWFALALVQATLLASLPGGVNRIGAVLLLHGAIAMAWTAMTPIIARATNPSRLRTVPLPAALMRHVFLLLCAGLADTMVRRGMLVALGAASPLPWYATLLYYADRTFVSYLLVVIAARTLVAHDLFVSRQRQALALQAQLARARLAALEERLHPHFLFNALGAVMELTHEAPARAAAMLRQLASVLDFAITRRTAEVTLREEVAALEPYLAVQRTRFEDWLEIECDIDPSASELLLPPLVLQPLVENSIRHGLSERVAAGQILIRAARAGDALTIEVRDNGVGLSSSRAIDGRGIGLSNVRERIAALYGDEADLQLFSDAKGVTVARLTLPARSAIAIRADDAPAPNEDPVDETSVLPAFLRTHPVLAVVLAWAAWGLLWTQQSIAYLAIRHRLAGTGLLDIALRDFMTSMLWAALVPLMLLCLKLVPLARPFIGVRLALHAAAAIGIAGLHGALSSAFVHRVPVAVRTPEGIAALVWGVLAYTTVVTLAYQGTIREWLRERELTAARLRLNLAEAALGAATARSRPRELLDRLEAIARTVTANPARAEHDLMLLGDQLRADLDARVPA